MKKALPTLALAALFALPAQANEGASIDTLRQTTMNLIDALVDTGERLLLRSKSTGEEFGFRLSVMEDGDTDPQSAGNTDATGLSRLVNGATVTQAAADAKATVNGIAVSSATNTCASTISGVTFKAEQVTTAPIDITVSKDNSAIQSNIDGFVKAYNAINQLLPVV